MAVLHLRWLLILKFFLDYSLYLHFLRHISQDRKTTFSICESVEILILELRVIHFERQAYRGAHPTIVILFLFFLALMLQKLRVVEKKNH